MCQYIHHKPSSISQSPQGRSLSLHHRLTVCCPVVPVNKETDTHNDCLFLPSSHSQTGRTGTIFWPRLWLEGSGLRFVREECVIHSWNTGFINVLASHLKPRMFPLSVTVRRASSLQLSTVSVNDYRADLDLPAALFKTRCRSDQQVLLDCCSTTSVTKAAETTQRFPRQRPHVNASKAASFRCAEVQLRDSVSPVTLSVE